MKTEAIIKNFLRWKMLYNDEVEKIRPAHIENTYPLTIAELTDLCNQVLEAQTPGKKLGISPTNKLSYELDQSSKPKPMTDEEILEVVKIQNEKLLDSIPEGYTEIVKIVELALDQQFTGVVSWTNKFVKRYPNSKFVKPFKALLNGDKNPDKLRLEDETRASQ